MFKNYLLTAWKVLLRRKFFTFVNLFGIAITLAVLTLVVAMFDNYLRPAGAESRSDLMLEVSILSLESEDRRSNWVSEPGYRFMQEYIVPMESPAMVSLFGTTFPGTSWVDGQKHSLNMRYTDGNYWKMLTFDFIEGGPISSADNEQGRMVMVINRASRDRIFGERDVVGDSLVVNGQSFEIIGVVENEPEMSRHAFADIWVPYNTNPSATWREQMMGGFNALLLARDKAGLEEIKLEYREALDNFEYEDPTEFAVAVGGADNKLEAMAREFTNSNQQHDSGASRFIGLMIGGMLVFMLLPSINMINLNTSRILERAPEIGVRKAFGASSATLVGQFIVENLVLTLIGGLLGFLLALLLLDFVNASGIIKYANLAMHGRTFLVALLLIGVFGVLSGAYPAWRMSRMRPVEALRGA